ncbi:redoxin domain-containing protein [Oscillatoria amoena NRMC-F 0135]|nr:redoxin domain-containing protein [Oscillatoria laete-virens]MCD8487191.1 redoxin domain-containing protein [Desertifilum sp.]MDI9634936.1 redoxin domain-containing protein [Geitlerinema splendidum]MDL5044885.1 redoxin domain-containing protein [Oscillatoria amoena NRMC-F 0135]MDL5053746.1 redoxin domain-containing protein [Oscillatoria laete-virens NRMC-F 0139]
MSVVSVRLSVGDRIPAFNLPSQTGEYFNIGDFAGKPLVICFFPNPLTPDCIAQAREIQTLLPQLEAIGVNLIGVSPTPVEVLQNFAQTHQIQFKLLSDPKGALCQEYGILYGNAQNQSLTVARQTFVVNIDLRIIKVYNTVDPHQHASQLLEDLQALLATEVPRHITRQAPVLLIPNVFDREFCQHLINIWHTQGNGESGFMRQVNGQTVGLIDHSHKIRRDHFLQNGETKERIRYLFGKRVTPEIWKAYCFNVTRFEDFRIVGYDASRGGYFRPHRDNTTAGTAHRRFAMTINLNAGEYEGGYLRFPEYGPHLYRPDTGSAVVFSCSLLHEATDVTAGLRFALLTFFYGEREAQIRDEYRKRNQGSEDQNQAYQP